MKIRIKFKKSGLMKFIGHLDLVRAWQKIFRRSGIPIAYSEGFNPHQIFSLASPLAVGVTGDGEYLDLKLRVETYDLKELISQINKVCPEGLEVIAAVELEDKQTAGMAACYASRYKVTLSEELAKLLGTKEEVIAFMAEPSIIVKKKNKKGRINDLDIKTGMFETSYNGREFELLLATGSTLNIKPELLMKALFEKFQVELESFTKDLYYTIHRYDVYTQIDPLKTLIEFDL